MAVHEGAGHLAKAFKELLGAWEETRLSWDDAMSSRFEDRYMAPLRVEVRKAAEAMSAMAALLEQIRQECG